MRELSKVVEAQVFGPSGQKIGDVDEVLIEPRSGRIEYVLLHDGRHTPFHVRWEDVLFDDDSGALVLRRGARLRR